MLSSSIRSTINSAKQKYNVRKYNVCKYNVCVQNRDEAIADTFIHPLAISHFEATAFTDAPVWLGANSTLEPGSLSRKSLDNLPPSGKVRKNQTTGKAL